MQNCPTMDSMFNDILPNEITTIILAEALRRATARDYGRIILVCHLWRTIAAAQVAALPIDWPATSREGPLPEYVLCAVKSDLIDWSVQECYPTGFAMRWDGECRDLMPFIHGLGTPELHKRYIDTGRFVNHRIDASKCMNSVPIPLPIMRYDIGILKQIGYIIKHIDRKYLAHGEVSKYWGRGEEIACLCTRMFEIESMYPGISSNRAKQILSRNRMRREVWNAGYATMSMSKFLASITSSDKARLVIKYGNISLEQTRALYEMNNDVARYILRYSPHWNKIPLREVPEIKDYHRLFPRPWGKALHLRAKRRAAALREIIAPCDHVAK